MVGAAWNIIMDAKVISKITSTQGGSDEQLSQEKNRNSLNRFQKIKAKGN